MSWLAGIGSRAWARLAAIGAGLAAIGMVYARGRQSGKDAVRADAAASEQRLRGEGDAAAADAQRDGAAARLRDGRF